MKLILNLTPQGIIVNCEIDVNTREYSFALSTDFNIINICNNGNKISLQNGELCELEFRPAMKKYQITNLEKGTLSFTYSGMPHDDDFAFYQKDLIHLSLYNGWYPIGFDVAEQYDIELFAKQGWEQSLRFKSFLSSQKTARRRCPFVFVGSLLGPVFTSKAGSFRFPDSLNENTKRNAGKKLDFWHGIVYFFRKLFISIFVQ